MGCFICRYTNMFRMEAETRAGALLVFEVIRLLGITETSSPEQVDEEINLLRILTPLCKLYTAKQVRMAATTFKNLFKFLLKKLVIYLYNDTFR